MDPEQFTRIAKALADPRRFELLQRIAAEEEVGCMVLAEEFPISQATISHHLRDLAEAGLVLVRRESKYGYCRVRRDVFAAYVEELQRRVLAEPGPASTFPESR